MCGIAGLFSKSLDVSESLGSHLGDMLLQLSDRGPDSAGVAFYREPAPSGSSKVSLFSPDPQQDWGAVRDALDEAFGAGEPEPRGSHAVIVVETDAAEAQSWLREGASLEQALEGCLEDLDGFYTFAVGTADGFAVLRDPIACKPAVMAENDDWVAMASEYRAIAVLPGAEGARTWEPEPGRVYSWERAAV